MEKFIFKDNSELAIDAISQSGDMLHVSVNGGDIVALEATFSDPDKLEKIILADSKGNPMSAFKNFAILKELRKQKNVVVNDITDETADIVTVTLEKEPDWVVSQRKQDAKIAAVEETADMLVMDALV